MSKLIPLAGYVLVEALPDEDKTESGLYTPESMKDKPAKGKVLEVGPRSLENIKLMEEISNTGISLQHKIKYIDSIRKGQIVVFKRWNGTPIRDGDKDVTFLAFDDILGVYEDG